MLLLSLENVLQCGGLNMMLYKEDVKKAFLKYYNNEIIQPLKLHMEDPMRAEGGHLNIMPAMIKDKYDETISLKVIGSNTHNTEKGLPRATGLITLFDNETKIPICMMDVQVISAMRTGAVTALAADFILQKNIKRIGLLGAGVNMRTQILALKEVARNSDSIFVYSKGKSKFKFAKEMEDIIEHEFIPVESPDLVAKDMDLIITCTPNMGESIIKSDWVNKNNVTMISVGCNDVEEKLFQKFDRIIVDDWECMKSRDCDSVVHAYKNNLISEEKIELFPPIVSDVKPGRIADENINFTTVGMGFHDAIVAKRIYQYALQHNIGTQFNLWNDPKWI